MHTYTPANSIFDGPVTNLFSILCSLIEVLSCGQAKGEKGFNDFKFGTFMGRFQSVGAASMAVKGLTWLSKASVLTPRYLLFSAEGI